MEAMPLTLLLVSDDPVVQSAVTAALRSTVAWRVTYPAVPERWTEHACRTQPDILLVDRHVGGRDVAPTLPSLSGSLPTTMVATLVTPPARSSEPKLLEAGAFVCYEKRSMHVRHLGAYLREDVRLFARALMGEDVRARSCHERFMTAARAWRSHAESPTTVRR
jgi:DNA-binding NarL/FixJ family response regulator